jgi:hypothetical protein
MKKVALITFLVFFNACAFHAAGADDDGTEHITALVAKGRGSPVVLEKQDSITTRATFKPPVQITIVAKTDTTNLRMGYAANQVIFNWEVNKQEFRVDGGPAGGKHKMGAGVVPTNKYVTIKWIVTPKKQSIYVDDQLRYEHEGDYSRIDNPVSVFCNKSKVTVRTIKVKQLPAGTE